MSAAKTGAELLSLGLVPQLHRPEVFAPWNRVPGSILARGGQQQRWAADDHDSIKKRDTKIKGSCLLASVLFSCGELVLTWPACGRAATWNCSLQVRYFNFISHCGSKTGSGSSRVLALRTAYHLLLWLCCYSLPPEADTWRWWRTSSLSSISPCTSCWGGIFPILAATGDSVEPSAMALLPPVACTAFSCSSHTKRQSSPCLSEPTARPWGLLGCSWATSSTRRWFSAESAHVPWRELVLCGFWQEQVQNQ